MHQQMLEHVVIVAMLVSACSIYIGWIWFALAFFRVVRRWSRFRYVTFTEHLTYVWYAWRLQYAFVCFLVGLICVVLGQTILRMVTQ